ncbi:MAG: MucR family transcriptional regulator [Hyphomonadaceae bacterium]
MRGDEHENAASGQQALRMTADIVASFVRNNRVTPEQLTELIRSVHRTLDALAHGHETAAGEKLKPAVAPAKSVHDDYIVCLEDGKKLKMLKRYLRSTYGLSPEQYRKRWGLPADYPMVAPAYAARRSEFAKRIGLGRGVRRKD